MSCALGNVNSCQRSDTLSLLQVQRLPPPFAKRPRTGSDTHVSESSSPFSPGAFPSCSRTRGYTWQDKNILPGDSCPARVWVKACVWKPWGTSHLAAIYLSAGRQDQPRGMCSMARSFQFPALATPAALPPQSRLLARARSGLLPALPPSASLMVLSPGAVGASGGRGCPEAEMAKLLPVLLRKGQSRPLPPARVWAMVPRGSCLGMLLHQQRRNWACGLCCCICGSSQNPERAVGRLPLTRRSGAER